MKILFFLSAVLSFAYHTSQAQQGWRVTHQELILDKPPFPQCHASTIEETADGRLMAAWFGGTREGNKDVSIWMSEKKGSTWTKPKLMVEGLMSDTLRYACWNPVLFQEKSGKLFLFYKVGPATKVWWGEVITSDDNGKTWSARQKLPDGIFGPIKNKPVQLKDGTIISPSSDLAANGKRVVHIERSVDGGSSWQRIPVDTASNQYSATQPSVFTYPGNRMQLLCRSNIDTLIQAWSSDNGNTWGKLTTTSLLNPNSGTDGLTLKNGDQLLVYNPTIRGEKWVNGREKLCVAVSKNGKDWKDIIVLEDGKVKEDYSYPAVIQSKDGKVHIMYTYNRKNMKYVVLEPIKKS